MVGHIEVGVSSKSMPNRRGLQNKTSRRALARRDTSQSSSAQPTSSYFSYRNAVWNDMASGPTRQFNAVRIITVNQHANKARHLAVPPVLSRRSAL
jgi:hypothetical protein